MQQGNKQGIAWDRAWRIRMMVEEREKKEQVVCASKSFAKKHTKQWFLHLLARPSSTAALHPMHRHHHHFSIWSTQIRKPPSNPWIVCTNTKQVAVIWVCPVSKDIFQRLSRWLPFRHFNPLTLLLQFHISEPPIWRSNPKSNSLWRKRWGQIQVWQF